MEVLRDQNWLLTVGTFLPMVGVLVMLFIPKADEELHKLVALATAVATLGVGIYTLTQFDFDQAGTLQFFADTEWIKVISSNYTIGLDGMSLPLYILSMVVTVLVMIYSWNHIPSPGNPKAFLSLMLILQTGMAGTFIVDGASAAISFCMRSAMPSNMVVPPDSTMLPYRSLRMSTSHFMIELYVVS